MGDVITRNPRRGFPQNSCTWIEGFLITKMWMCGCQCHLTEARLFYELLTRNNTSIGAIRSFSRSLSNLKGKSKNVTAQNWVQRQAKDVYVKKARFENYRCRSAFKLIEINEKFKILKPGNKVVDCGAAPGSWTQVAVEAVNASSAVNKQEKNRGHVIAVDLQHIHPIEGATVLSQSDFTDPGTQKNILGILGNQRVDVVISDMAPNATGVKSMDHELIVDLCFSALNFSVNILQNGGHFLCKLWQGNEQKRLENDLKNHFEIVRVVKPLASRKDSAEIFLLAKNFKGNS